MYKFFQKFLQKFSQDFDKILLENCSNFTNSLPKISRKFSPLLTFHKFPLQFHHISTFSQSINQSVQVDQWFLKHVFLDNFFFFLLKLGGWMSYARFTFLFRVLVETFGAMWTRRSTHECRPSHSRERIGDNEAGHSRHSRFLWLRTDLSTCFLGLQDETRTGWECGRQDECTLHTLVLILSRAVSTNVNQALN